MKKEDLDALASLYEGVYSPAESGEYLSENADLHEQGGTRGTRTGSNPNVWRPTPSAPGSRRGAAPVPTASRPAATQSRFAGARDAAIAKARQIKGSPVVGKGPAVKPAATTPVAAKPPTPGAGASTPAAKVAPSAAVKPAASAKPAGSAMDQWAAANPKLAAAKAERDRTRGTSATTNPLMQDMKSKLPAPKAPSPTTASTAFAKTSPSLSSSTPAVQSAGSSAAAKPTTNQSTTAFSSPAIVKPTPSTTPIKKPGAVMASFEWGSKATLKDVANAYASIYEAKKKDQDQDGDNDFADVRIARMIASGMSKAEAIAAVKNKAYNEEVEINEAEGSYGETPKAYSAASKTKMTAKRKPFLKAMLRRTNPANRKDAYASPRKGMTASDREEARAGAEYGSPRGHDYPSQGPGGITKSAKKLRKQKAMGEFGESYEIDEATLSAKAARAGKDIGAKGKNFAKIAASAAKRYGSVEAGKRVAGSILKKMRAEEYEIYEIVASYLLENNFAETLNDANVIIENMSENWLDEILEAKKPLPVSKMKKKESKLLDNEEGQLKALRTDVGSKERKARMKELQRFDNINSVRTSVAKRGGKQQHSMPEIGRYKPKDED